jgi:hypothetical protein
VRVRLVARPKWPSFSARYWPARATAKHRLQEPEVGALARAVEELRIVRGARLLAADRCRADVARNSRNAASLSGGGGSCTRKERHLLALGKEVRSADVRGEHAFLDQLVRVVARRRDDRGDLAVLVELDGELGRIEVDGAALLARGGERLVQRVEALRCGSRAFASASSPLRSDSHDHTSVYVRRARECITAGRSGRP